MFFIFKRIAPVQGVILFLYYAGRKPMFHFFASRY